MQKRKAILGMPQNKRPRSPRVGRSQTLRLCECLCVCVWVFVWCVWAWVGVCGGWYGWVCSCVCVCVPIDELFWYAWDEWNWLNDEQVIYFKPIITQVLLWYARSLILITPNLMSAALVIFKLRKGPHICLLNIYMALEGSEQPVLLFNYYRSVWTFGGCAITALSTFICL